MLDKTNCPNVHTLLRPRTVSEWSNIALLMNTLENTVCVFWWTNKDVSVSIQIFEQFASYLNTYYNKFMVTRIWHKIMATDRAAWQCLHIILCSYITFFPLSFKKFQFQYSCQFNSFSFIYIAPVTIKIVSRHAMLCHIMHHLTSLFSHFYGIMCAGGSTEDHGQAQRIFVVFMLFLCTLASLA